MDAQFVKARELARTAKQRLLAGFAANPNVVGAGFGKRTVQDERLHEPAIVVYVMRKVPKQFIPPSSLLPRRMYVGGDAIEVDVVETGPIHLLSFTARERPVPCGISIGHGPSGSTGTLGCVVTDVTDATACILSNNHVIANLNGASIGDAITQPGGADAGASPGDDIATLKRFIPLNPTGNRVDCAIAQITKAGTVQDQMKNNLMPVANANHPAVGLLFAGGCNRTFMNPIDTVLAALNIAFPAGASSTIAADLDMNVEKVGRTTEYTSSTISELDVSPNPNSPMGPLGYVNQIATMWMSDQGDSGSLVCRGGDGGEEDHCDCGTTTATSSVMGFDMRTDAAIEKEFRERYLRHTRVGRYLLDVFFRNEDRIVDRVRDAGASESDRGFARYLYDKHGDAIRLALLQPHRTDIRLSEEHLHDARESLGRAMHHMKDDERRAAEELFKLVYRARDRTPGEILGMLEDETLLREVRRILSQVRSLEQPPARSSHTPGDETKAE